MLPDSYTEYYCQLATCGLFHSLFIVILYSSSRVFLPKALFFYDTVLTFNQEVTCFRTAKRTWAMFLFLANKVLSLTVYVMSVIEFASFPSNEVSTLSFDT